MRFPIKKIIALVSVLLLSITVQAKDYLIDSVHIPLSAINKVANDGSFKITNPVLFMEVYSTSSGEIFLRSDGQSYGGNKTDFDFGKYGNSVDLSDSDFPLAVRILIGSKEGVERTARGVAAGGTCAVVGGVVGGVLAAAFTGGLGAAGGAAIGAAIGGAIGGTAGAIAPVSDAKEIIYFRFENASSFVGTTTKKPDGNDILGDGQEAKIIIKAK